MNRHLFLLLLTPLLLTHCASVETEIPVAHIIGPEALGKDGKNLGVSYTSVNSIEIVSDASIRPFNPSSDTSAVKQEHALTGNFDFAASDRLDILLKYSPSLTIFGGLKLQIFGEPQVRAKNGNLSFSLAAVGMYKNESKSGEQNGTFGAGGHPWKSELQTTSAELSALLGYRVQDGIALFTGPYFTEYNYKGKLHQTATTNPTYPEVDYAFEGRGRSKGIKVGTQIFTEDLHSFILQGTYSRFEWDGYGHDHFWTFGGLFNINLN